MKLHESRRRFIKTLGYTAPAIVTLKVVPAFASAGSGREVRQHGDDSSHSGRGRHTKRRNSHRHGTD